MEYITQKKPCCFLNGEIIIVQYCFALIALENTVDSLLSDPSVIESFDYLTLNPLSQFHSNLLF